MPDFLKSLGDEATALLVETRAPSKDELDKNIDIILDKLKGITPELPLRFTQNKDEYTLFGRLEKDFFLQLEL